MNFHDMPVFREKRREGGSEDAMEGMREQGMGDRHDIVKDDGKDRGSESDKQRQEGKGAIVTHEGKRVVVGRQQLEGMINSPDTSLRITAERRDRWSEGGMERLKERACC